MKPRLRCAPPRLATAEYRRVPPPPKTAASFYLSPEWRELMARLIKERGRRCERCVATGCRIYGDHIKELKDGGAPLDPANIMLMCSPCHGLKTAAARKERASTIYG